MKQTDKKRYFKPRLIVVPIDQEITLVMDSKPVNPYESSSLNGNTQSSEIFGDTTPNVGSETINWGKK